MLARSRLLVLGLLLCGFTFVLPACSTVKVAGGALAPMDATDCKVIAEKTIHYGFWGTVTADKEGVPVPSADGKVRVRTNRHGLDGFLAYLGSAFTFGLYSGPVTYTVEECQ